MEARRVLMISIIAVIPVLLLASPVLAYDDDLGAHSKINELAVEKFLSVLAPADPYLKYASLDGDDCAGLAWDPADGSKMLPPETAVKRTKSLEMWIIDGGWSADQPEGPAALVHFMDPQAPAGKRYLTDQQILVKVTSALDSTKGNPEIDALQWGFDKNFGSWGTVYDQQYGWEQGKQYLASGIQSTDASNENYGNAWRSLGECMHLVADMTVPAHVRNDGHAKILSDPDPYESTTSYKDVTANAYFDPAPLNYDQSAPQIMFDVAKYTNENFLSKDTVPLLSGVTSPSRKYPSPSIDGLKPDSNGYLHSTINDRDLRIAVKRGLLDRFFGTGASSYMIDDKVVSDQRTVLIPTAIRADASLVSRFLPRFQVTGKATDKGDGQYTMVGTIKGIDNVEWPAASSLKVRNGAYVVVKDAKSGKEKEYPVKLVDKSSDLNSFSYDFKANPGDTVYVKYDLGGYVIKSEEKVLEGSVTGARKPPVRVPQDVRIPAAPGPLMSYTETEPDGGKNVYTYYEGPQKQRLVHGDYTHYRADGSVESTKTVTFGKNYIGYYRVYYPDGKLNLEYFHGDDSVLQYKEQYTEQGYPDLIEDYWPNGNVKTQYTFLDGKLFGYSECDSSGAVKVYETYDASGKLKSRKTY